MPKKMRKRTLTWKEEFEILKIVIDKLLLLGFGIMAVGLFQMLMGETVTGLYTMIPGAILLLIVLAILWKEYKLGI